MKNFFLGGLAIIGLAFYGCYMFDLGRTDYALKFWGCKK